MKMIEVKDLTFSYDNQRNAVENVSFSIEKGKGIFVTRPKRRMGAGQHSIKRKRTYAPRTLPPLRCGVYTY